MAILKPSEIQHYILQEKFIPFFIHTNLSLCKKVMHSCYEKGIKVFEFTNGHPNSFEIFSALKQYRDTELPKMILGVGAIKNASQAKEFIEAGADFLISAATLQAIQEVCKKENIVWISGNVIPSELGLAENWNLSLVKVIPAKQLGGPCSIEL
jgi:2-dehydro-3-deoxyphosphogluconate aldolase/(4S)-4-hydroxy-2-oxoglutarate aldolase